MEYGDVEHVKDQENPTHSRKMLSAISGLMMLGTTVGLVACGSEEVINTERQEISNEQMTTAIETPDIILDLEAFEPELKVPDGESPGRLISSLLTNLQNAVNTGDKKYLEFFALNTDQGSPMEVAQELIDANTDIPEIFNESGGKQFTLTPEIISSQYIDTSDSSRGQIIDAAVIEKLTTYGNTPLPVISDTYRNYQFTLMPVTKEYIADGETVVAVVWLVKELYRS